MEDNYVSPTAPAIVRWLIKRSGGLIKTEKQATFVIFAFIILAILISLFLVFGGGGQRSPEETFAPPAEEFIPIYP